jgi:NAD(P)-dependent dehydrogenase (short-subunit alcohol dehydrogenase family)
MAGKTTIAPVTGANRVIGLEVVRQLASLGMTVILGARDLERGQAAARKLTNEGLKVLARQLDVVSQESIGVLAEEVERKFERLDILINNAGILYDTWQRATNASMETAHERRRRTCSARGACARRSRLSCGRAAAASSTYRAKQGRSSSKGSITAHSSSVINCFAMRPSLHGELRFC